MATSARRGVIYALLFTLLMISMLDRINMSVAGSSIAAPIPWSARKPTSSSVEVSTAPSIGW